MGKTLRVVFLGGAVFASILPAARAGDPPPPMHRVRGIIDRDQTWSGHVLITGSTNIDGATVTVAADTIIEFADATREGQPILTVGSPIHPGGQFEFQSTAEHPVTFRTRPETSAGRIVVFARARRATTTAPVVSGTAPATADDVPAWQHLRFENLGFPASAGAMMGAANLVEPALQIHLLDAGMTLLVSNCFFQQTSSLQIEARAAARITVADNRFVSPKSRTAIEIAANSKVALPEPAQITNNRTESAIRIHGASTRVEGNILVGRDACIVLEDAPAGAVHLTGNYIHNTSRDDDGHYGLNCVVPDALIEGNIVRGGTTCVLSGSRRFSRNILIGEPELASRVVRRAQTHQLVASLPAGAVFERNLLIGPAYALLIPQAAPTPGETSTGDAPTLIRNNVFDGLADSNRAIHLDPPDRAPGTVRVENNLFIRVPSMVYDESQKGRSLAYADYNAAAPSPRRAFDQVAVAGLKEGQDGWAAHDIRRDNIGELRLADVPDRIPDVDADMLSGRLTIAALREKLFDAYRPQSDSPLAGAGRVSPGDTPGARPSIGCCEPKPR